MRILLLGRRGQLATALRPLLEMVPQWSLEIAGRPDLDVTDFPALRRKILAAKPEVIVNATAYTAVDKAEREPDLAYAVNRDAVAEIGRAAQAAGAAVLHVSTDYVFDGRAERPYREDDPTGPLGVYGASKLAGEDALAKLCGERVVIRTSWLYGASGQNFLRAMLRLGRERERLAIVDDQRGCPTAVDDLAAAIVAVLRRIAEGGGVWGTFHYANAGGPVSWYDFAAEIFRQASGLGLSPVPILERTTTAAFGAPAPRPLFSLLDCRRIDEVYGVERPDWRQALARVLAQIKAQEDEQDSGGEG